MTLIACSWTQNDCKNFSTPIRLPGRYVVSTSSFLVVYFLNKDGDCHSQMKNFNGALFTG